MRQKRAKAYRKLMALYSMSFGFRQPYQVLVNSELCKTATEQKLELLKHLGSVLQGTVKLMITQCCIHELYLQGKLQQPAVDLAKSFERRKCNHKEAIPGDECLASVIGDSNKHRYVVATLSQPLRVKLREIPAVPIVHINRSVMVLEPPSDATLKSKETSEEQALHPTASDLALLPPKDIAEPLHKKKKGPKGPNPLSVKKKKTKPDEVTPSTKEKGKEKAGAAGERSRNVSSNEGDDIRGRSGGKRKRSEAEEQTGRLVASDALTSKEGNGGHKRKRRRKDEATSIPKAMDS